MKRSTALIGLAVLAAAGGGIFWMLTVTRPLPADALKPRTADLANGATMFNVGGCASCHATPKEDAKAEDRLKLGGGFAMHTAFGTFKAPNISPDPKAGIGSWTEAEFVNAMWNGVGRAGEHLYPSFPYTSYQRMRLDDVRDLFAYMKTLPAVATPSASHELKFPFNVRRGLGLWKMLFLDGKRYEPPVGATPQMARGGYFVEGPGHCAECHSPRNVMGGIDAARRFAGGPNPDGEGWVPNITQHADGLAKWSVKDIEYLLESGQTPEGDSVGGSMAEVSINSGNLKKPDREAMAVYLKSLPARPGKAPPKKKE